MIWRGLHNWWPSLNAEQSAVEKPLLWNFPATRDQMARLQWHGRTFRAEITGALICGNFPDAATQPYHQRYMSFSATTTLEDAQRGSGIVTTNDLVPSSSKPDRWLEVLGGATPTVVNGVDQIELFQDDIDFPNPGVLPTVTYGFYVEVQIKWGIFGAGSLSAYGVGRRGDVYAMPLHVKVIATGKVARNEGGVMVEYDGYHTEASTQYTDEPNPGDITLPSWGGPVAGSVAIFGDMAGWNMNKSEMLYETVVYDPSSLPPVEADAAAASGLFLREIQIDIIPEETIPIGTL